MKRSESKQLAGYIFACCIALVPSLHLLAGFAVQCLLAVSLSQLASTFGRYNQNLVTGHCYYVHEMKREETTSRLYFRMLYYTGAELAFIGWICGTEPIGSVAMPVSQYKKVLQNMTLLGTSSEHHLKIWVHGNEGTTDGSWHYLNVAHFSPLYSFEHVPSQVTYAVRLLDWLG